MTPLHFLSGFLIIAPIILFAQSADNASPCIPCERLRELNIPNVTILSAEAMQSDTSMYISKPFCKVLGRISKEINFELLLPNKWNKRFLMSGGGGFSGSIQNELRGYVNYDYVTAGTDTGHKGSIIQADWALNNMERQVNFGHLSIHLTTVVSKYIVEKFYCEKSSYSYFVGCSRGGGQGMVEAQYYPEDFNGIVVGAPAFGWPANAAKYISECQHIYPDPDNLNNSVITGDNLKLLQTLVFKKCDALDGVADQIINDPRKCKIDFSQFPKCKNDIPGQDCFTSKQLAAIVSVYSPLVIDSREVYPGFPVGLESEQGSWDPWIANNGRAFKGPALHYSFGTNVFRYLVFNDSTWDYTKYDFKDFFRETKYASSFLDATQTDYREFKSAKGKMIFYHGWNDPALSAFATIQHFEEAQRKDNDLQSYIRLFLLPGMLHCDGGTGPDKVDWLKQIQEWVENGTAPEKVIASKSVNGKVVMTRPVFPYPRVAVYKGKGNTNDAQNFVSGNN